MFACFGGSRDSISSRARTAAISIDDAVKASVFKAKGNALTKKMRFEEAIAAYESGMNLFTDAQTDNQDVELQSHLLSNLSNAQNNFGLSVEAEQSARECIQIDPTWMKVTLI
jgi:exonuclease VII small subunit